jgi:hypothetical protein
MTVTGCELYSLRQEVRAIFGQKWQNTQLRGSCRLP